MGRAIVRQPSAFLMDEPLSNLDAKLRVQMRAEIARLQRDLETTTIYVTHDQVEAMTMGDRVAVMRKGELQQVAPPQELYDHPVNLFVGGFIGSPAMNMLEGTLERQDGGVSLAIGSQRSPWTRAASRNRPALRRYEGRQLIVGIRPEDLEDAALTDDSSGHQLEGEVSLREALGSEIMVHFTIDAKAAETEDTRELARDAGTEGLEGGALESGGTLMVARFDPHSKVSRGQAARRSPSTHGRLHFFDPETGLGIYDQDAKGAGS